MTTPNTKALIGELASANIPFKTASDSDWASYSSTYNTRLPVIPAVVVVPTTVEHISNAVVRARQHGLKVQARCGGHSYASFSSGGVDGAVIIDLRNLQSIKCDSDLVEVDGGVRLGNMAAAIYAHQQRKRALPHGTCAGVGIGGHYTHGGYGFFSRAWGLAMDRIKGLDVVTADGRCVFASEKENSDLFYAMRGAGDSFGIATTFYLDTLPAPESVIHWTVKISDVTESVERAVRAFQRLQDFVHDESAADRNIGLNVNLASNYFSMEGTYIGSRERFFGTVLPGLQAHLRELAEIKVEEKDWPTTLKSLNENKDIHTPKDHQEHSNFFAKSVVVPEPGFTSEPLTDFFTYLIDNKCPPVSYFILVDLYGGVDSQISNKDLDFSAFAHRDALWVVQIYGHVGGQKVFPQEGLNFINGIADAMTKHLPRHGAYSNYTDPSLTREEAHKQYHGEKLYKRLKAIKEKWDPEDVFSNPQSI